MPQLHAYYILDYASDGLVTSGYAFLCQLLYMFASSDKADIEGPTLTHMMVPAGRCSLPPSCDVGRLLDADSNADLADAHRWVHAQDLLHSNSAY